MLNIEKYLRQTLEVQLSRKTLREMVSLVSSKDNITLLGFNDYTKHIVNLFPEKHIEVLDIFTLDSPIRFRNVEIQTMPGSITIGDYFLITDYENIPQYQSLVYNHPKWKSKPLRYPNFFGEVSTKVYDNSTQSPFYRQLITETDTIENIDNSMMKKDGVLLLLELLKGTNAIEGDIIEIGVWQGGSALYLSKAMQLYNLDKDLYLFDFFEDHPRDHPKGIMCIDELKRKFDFNPRTKFVSGDIRKTIKQIKDKPLSFIHYDMGYQKAILDVVVTNLNPGGIILLDNYGHTASKPSLFDEYFATFGLHCMRIPYSEQCIIFKN